MSYTAVNLTQDSIDKLQARFPTPEGWLGKSHHMTIHMGKRRAGDPEIGTEVRLTAFAVGTNGRATAVKVECDVKSANNIPHITLAVNRGCKPVESNNIKVWREIKRIELEGTVEQNG